MRDLNLASRSVRGIPTYFVLLDVGVLITLVLLASIQGLERRGALLSMIIVGSAVLLTTSHVVFSERFPTHDSYLVHYPIFHHIGATLASGTFPEWFPVSGGVRMGLSHAYAYDAPYRLIGYLLYAVLPASAMTVYKLQYVLGAAGRLGMVVGFRAVDRFALCGVRGSVGHRCEQPGQHGRGTRFDD